MTDKKNFFTLIRLAKISKLRMFSGVFYSICNKLCDIIPEILIGITIDVVVNKEQSLIGRLGFSDPFMQLYIVAIGTILFWLLESLFEYLYSVVWYNLAQDLQHNFRIELYDKIQKADMQFIESRTLGNLLSIIDDDINHLELFFAKGCNDIIQLLTNTCVMGTLFFFISPTIALLSMLPVPFVILISYFFRLKIAAAYAATSDASNEIRTQLASRLRGILTIKSYTMENSERVLLEKKSNYHKTVSEHGNKIISSYIPIVRMVVLCGFIASLMVGGTYAIYGVMTISWYAAFVFLTQRFLWPFAGFASIVEQYEKFCSSASRVLELYRIENTVKDGDITINTQEETIQGTISFQDVSFSYDTKTTVLKEVNFILPQGKMFAFVGASGSGKSTIAKLLLRLYDVDSGAICIDNVNINSYKLADLRKNIALVSQDVYLINGSIKDNICYGSEVTSMDEVVRAAKCAVLHDFIIGLPEGYNTIVSEQGANMSGGEKQRIAIARAILKNARIIIFDEASSALDNETESLLQFSINQLKSKHTIIVIAHRLSTVQNADMICVLERGSIVESGTHNDLLLQQGKYEKLWNLQNKNQTS